MSQEMIALNGVEGHQNADESDIEANNQRGRAQPSLNVTPPTRPGSLNKFQQAIGKDDYYQFSKLLSSIRKNRTKLHMELFSPIEATGESVFETLLSSNDYKAAKFLSVTLKECELWNDVDFHKAENENKKKLMHFASKSETAVENFFSYFMFDWFDPDGNQTDRNYLLVFKSQQYYDVTGKSLLEKLYEIIDDDKSKIYRDVCLRMIYQCLHELDINDEYDSYFQTNRAILVSDHEYREKVLQILVVFWRGFPNYNSEYKELKEKVMKAVESDEGNFFFKLAFLLIEKEVARFTKLLMEQAEHYKKLFCDYFEFAVKPHVRLLLKIAYRQGFFKAAELILSTYPFIEEYLSVMMNFYDVQDFKIFNLVPFKSIQLITAGDFNLNTITELINSYDEKTGKETKRFLFGRNIGKERCCESIYENILSTRGAQLLIVTIWSKFDLCRREEILRIKNPQGKYLLEYVIESKDDENLILFLKPDRKKCYLKMQSDQFFLITKRSIYEQYLAFKATSKSDFFKENFFLAVTFLLEEVGRIQDIYTDVPIDKLLELAQNNKSYFKLLNLNNKDSRDPQEIEDWKHHLKLIDRLLANIVSYWTTTDINYIAYKNKIMESSLRPFFVMIFEILENRQEDFVNNFLANLSQFGNGAKERYGGSAYKPGSIFKLMHVLLVTAMKNDRRQVIDRILEYENFMPIGVFKTFKFNFYLNFAIETSNYVVKKLLEYGHGIFLNNIPSKLISPKVFKEFLDSRINDDDEELVEINCKFFQPVAIGYHIARPLFTENELIFIEDTRSLQYIVKSESLKEFITHPVISTYLELKRKEKFQSFYTLNLILFMIFLVSFGIFIICHFLNYSYIMRFLSWTFCPFFLIIFIAREYLQYRFVDNSLKSYLKKMSNWLEVSLIVISSMMLITFYINPVEYIWILDILSVSTLLLMTVVMLTMLPFDSMLLHMMMLKTVATTFIIFFSSFVCILVAMTISFCVIFKNVPDLKQSEDDAFKVFKNFHNFADTFVKVLLMLSGEYTVEPFTLAPIYQMIFFILFILSTFIIFNLILGLTIDDVKKIRGNARFLILKHKAEQFVETCETCSKVFWCFQLDHNEIENLDFLDRPFVKFFKYLITIHPSKADKLNKFYVSRKTKEMTLNSNLKPTWYMKSYMDDEDFESLKEILENRRIHTLTTEPVAPSRAIDTVQSSGSDVYPTWGGDRPVSRESEAVAGSSQGDKIKGG